MSLHSYPVFANGLTSEHGSFWSALPPPPPPQEPGAGRRERGEHSVGVGPLHRLSLLLLPSCDCHGRDLLQLPTPLTGCEG